MTSCQAKVKAGLAGGRRGTHAGRRAPELPETARQRRKPDRDRRAAPVERPLPGYNAALKNALDFLHQEWADKPVGIVSYGGISAGIRATQQLKPVLDALRMAVAVEAVNVPFVANLVREGGFHPTDVLEASAVAMLDELVRLEGLLRPARSEVRMQLTAR
ncbi:NAD(P)H-dependent oxidoreductase [Georgenia sp. EYE_87]|uniref:NADPH-dependent FMN reductase n=1 Tax=Georgenia sp. EYE_87 TaxID=2853448 RepID=UPI002003B98B|nr:NAD(P)H-dependent oxidoreductase [Georgenia sp. EYE_87]MCK6210437.1 NAD(P)H-dependent oxidoreductase [Georgenia sp. EYE_87]